MKDWKKHSDVPLMGIAAPDLRLRIEVQVEDIDDFGPVLAEAKRVASTLVKRGETGRFEVQYCSSASSITIERAPS